MATLAAPGFRANADQRERRFFLTMAIAMAAVIVAGFSLNLAMGRSTFAVPPIYHVHAGIFFGWVVLYVLQNGLIAANNTALHRRLGILAFAWVPLMVVIGTTVMIASLRRTGGPFFFDQNQFLISNPMLLLLFAGFVMTGLARRRETDWHRRMMFMGMAVLTGPGIGRLLPMPLMIPHAWHVAALSPLIFPVIAMIADKRRQGTIHPAYIWGVAAYLATQAVADLIAYSPLGIALTEQVVSGSPGAARPMQAFLPPGFAI